MANIVSQRVPIRDTAHSLLHAGGDEPDTQSILAAEALEANVVVRDLTETKQSRFLNL